MEDRTEQMGNYSVRPWRGVSEETVFFVKVAAEDTLRGLFDVGFRDLPHQTLQITDMVEEMNFPDCGEEGGYTCGLCADKWGMDYIHDGSIRKLVEEKYERFEEGRYRDLVEDTVAEELVHAALSADPPEMLVEYQPSKPNTYWEYENDLREMFAKAMLRRLRGVS